MRALPSMRSQGTPSEAEASSSVATDLPLQRDTRCGSLRSRVARGHQNHVLQHGVFGHVVSIVHSFTGQHRRYGSEVHIRTMDRILRSSHSSHCRPRKGICGHPGCKEFTNASSILLHVMDGRAPWQNGRTERHGGIHKRKFRARSLDALSERSCSVPAPCHGMQRRQESTVQSFRLLSPAASVRYWTSSSRGLDQRRRLRA